MAGGSIMAANTQAGAAKNAAAQQMQMYNQTRSDLMPYNQAGQSAINQLMSYWGLGTAGGGTGGTGGGGQQSPGVLAAMAGGVHSKGMGLRELASPIGLFRKNASPLQDIAAALQQGIPISDASWAKAGFGPGGWPVGSGPPQAPATGGGAPTAGSAANAFDMLKNYPGYQFQYGQGLEALNRNLSAGGRYTSGAMMKDAQTYGQGQAESAVTNYLQMLQYLGSLGQNSAAQTGNLGAGAAARSGQFGAAAGAANAGGTLGAAGALGGLAQNQNFQSLFNGSGGGVSPITPGLGGYVSGGGVLPDVFVTPGIF